MKMDAEEKFDENHLKPNEIIIGPFYTTYGDDKSIWLTTIEFHKKWNERGWNSRCNGCFIEDGNVLCLPIDSKHPKYVFKRIFIGKEGNINKYNIIIRFKTGGDHAVGSIAEPWWISDSDKFTKEPFLVFVRVYRGKIIAQERFEPVGNETEKQYKKRLWAETKNIIICGTSN